MDYLLPSLLLYLFYDRDFWFSPRRFFPRSLAGLTEFFNFAMGRQSGLGIPPTGCPFRPNIDALSWVDFLKAGPTARPSTRRGLNLDHHTPVTICANTSHPYSRSRSRWRRWRRTPCGGGGRGAPSHGVDWFEASDFPILLRTPSARVLSPSASSSPPATDSPARPGIGRTPASRPPQTNGGTNIRKGLAPPGLRAA